MKKDYTIEIIVKHSDSEEVAVKGTALTFESAGEQLGKLERFIKKQERDERISNTLNKILGFEEDDD